MHGDGDGGHNVFETLLLPQRTQAAFFFITDSRVLANEGVSQPMSTTAECPKVKQNLSKKCLTSVSPTRFFNNKTSVFHHHACFIPYDGLERIAICAN